MDLLTIILKIAAMLASGVFATLAIVTDYRGDDKKLNRWGRTAVFGSIGATVLSLVLLGLEMYQAREAARVAEREAKANAAVLKDVLGTARETSTGQKQSLDHLRGVTADMTTVLRQQERAVRQGSQISTKVTATLDAQASVLGAQRHVATQVLRAHYPLEPVTLFFEREFPMAQPELERYLARVRPKIAAKLRASRTDGKPVADDLRGEAAPVDLMESAEWQPVADGVEHEAYLALLTDTTSFSFADGAQANEIVFSSFPPEMRSLVKALSPGERMVQKIRLSADFQRQVITQFVRCDFAVRSGADVSAVSAIDLIGRSVSRPPPGGRDVASRVTRVALRFRYDYDLPPTRSRYIVLPPDGAPAAVTAEHIGLEGIAGGVPR